jgi:ribonucleotide monophosphatase NagD (HAD superfamily)
LGQPDPARIVMIGDSLDHDVAGARSAGMLTVLLSSGVHRELLENSLNEFSTFRMLAGAGAPMPHWTMKRLAW